MLDRFTALALLGKRSAEVVLGIRLVQLARTFERCHGTSRDGLGLLPTLLPEQTRGLVRQLHAAFARG